MLFFVIMVGGTITGLGAALLMSMIVDTITTVEKKPAIPRHIKTQLVVRTGIATLVTYVILMSINLTGGM